MDDKLFISPITDQCHICDNHFKHRQYNIMLPLDIDLVEICLRTCHPKCQSAFNRYTKAKEKLLDAEFNLFLLKNK